MSLWPRILAHVVAVNRKVIGRERAIEREPSRPMTDTGSSPRSSQPAEDYLNVTDEELRKGLEVSWKRRTLKAVAGGQNA
jgi:hypothetical protein